MMTELRPWRRNTETKLPSPPRRKGVTAPLPPSVRVFSRKHGGIARALLWAWTKGMEDLMSTLSPRPEFIDRSLQQELKECFTRQVVDGDDAGRRFCFEAAWMRLHTLWRRNEELRFVLTYPASNRRPAIAGGQATAGGSDTVASLVQGLWQARRRDSSLVVGYMFETPDEEGSARGEWTCAGCGPAKYAAGSPGAGRGRMLKGGVDAPDMPQMLALLRGTRQSTPRSEGLVWEQSPPGRQEKRARKRCGACAPCLRNLLHACLGRGADLDLEQGGGYGPQYRDASVHLRAVNADHDLAEGAVPGGGRGTGSIKSAPTGQWSSRCGGSHPRQLANPATGPGPGRAGGMAVGAAPGSSGHRMRPGLSGFRFWWSKHPSGRLRSVWN